MSEKNLSFYVKALEKFELDYENHNYSENIFSLFMMLRVLLSDVILENKKRKETRESKAKIQRLEKLFSRKFKNLKKTMENYQINEEEEN